MARPTVSETLAPQERAFIDELNFHWRGVSVTTVLGLGADVCAQLDSGVDRKVVMQIMTEASDARERGEPDVRVDEGVLPTVLHRRQIGLNKACPGGIPSTRGSAGYFHLPIQPGHDLRTRHGVTAHPIPALPIDGGRSAHLVPHAAIAYQRSLLSPSSPPTRKDLP